VPFFIDSSRQEAGAADWPFALSLPPSPVTGASRLYLVKKIEKKNWNIL